MSIPFTCSCGQAITATDYQAGAEMKCPGCGNSVIVPTDRAGLLGYVAPAAGNPIVTPRTIDLLRQTSLWVRIMSILMFIGAGFMLLAAGLLAVTSLVLGRGGPSGPPIILAFLYVPMALLYAMPALLLWRYASHSKAFVTYRHEQQLEEAMQAQKSFWKFVVITAFVCIGLYLLAIPIFLIAATKHGP